jgi:hypothetical protein
MDQDQDQAGRAARADRWIIAGWSLAVTLVFAPGLIAGDSLPKCYLWFCEMGEFYLPNWNFAAEMLKAGLMPTWAPQVHCGFPFSCFPGGNLYYPPFYLLLHLGVARADTLETMLCYALGGAFAYRAFRRLGLSPAAALAGTLASVGGMYADFESSNFWGQRELLAFPLCCWGIVGLARGGRRFGSWLALMWGTVLLSFHTEAFTYGLLFFLVLAPALSERGSRLRNWFLAGSALAAGVLAAWAPLLCLADYTHTSIRGSGLTFEYYRYLKFPWVTYAGMAWPFRTPNWFFGFYPPWYLGWSVLWLVGLALVRRGRPAWVLLGAAAAVVVLIVNPGPLAWVLYRLPVMNRMIQPYYYMPELVILAATLAAQGADEAMKAAPSRRAWAVAALLALGLLGGAAMDRDGYRAALLVPAGLGLAAAAFRPDWLAAPFRRAALMAGFIIADATFMAVVGHYRSPMKLFAPQPEAAAIVAGNGLERFWTLTRLGYTDTGLHPNLGMDLDPMLPGTASPLSYWRLPPRRTAEVINLICPGYLEFRDGKLLDHRRERALTAGALGPGARPLLALLNVGWIISRGVEAEGFEKVPAAGELTVYRNPEVLPRVRAVASWRVAESGEASLAAMGAGGMDFSRQAVIESRSGVLAPAPDSSEPHEVVIRRRWPGFWDLDVIPPSAGTQSSLLVVTETLLPGWRAFLDGREIPLHFADHAFIGAIIPPGPHQLTLSHQPWSFRAGIWISIPTMVLWPFWVLIRRRDFRPR